MIKFPKISRHSKTDSQSLLLPLLPLRDIVVFPHMVVPLFVGRDKSVSALAEAMNTDKRVFLATQKKAGLDNPQQNDISINGTIGKVLQLLRLPDGTVKALVEGKQRGCVTRYIQNEGFFQVEVEPLIEMEITKPAALALMRTIIELFGKYAKYNQNISDDLVNKMASVNDASQLADSIAVHFPFKVEDKQQLLEMPDLNERLELLLDLMRIELEIAEMDINIKKNVKKRMDKTQKEYYLNEQMRAIKKEMGTEENPSDDLKDLEKQIEEKKMSAEAMEKARQEFRKLKMMPPMSAESSVVRNYIEWMLDLPWFDISEVNKDIAKAETILDEDHYGLKKPKERILEYLAVQLLVKKVRGPILCFVGPPGVGKTSLARSIARATGREYIRLSLGGVRDEAEIRGHRRTYLGSMPGKIIQSLKKAGVNNPVYCLDEVDKMSMDFRGDPSSALLEVLDPEQNNTFNDHYMDVDYDLSDILFVTTANTLDIPYALKDRMEIIRLAGYAEYEKYQIAKQFLIPKQIKANGLEDHNLQFSKNSVLMIIQRYTREAGVRNLEREIASICRKIAREVVKKQSDKEHSSTDQEVKEQEDTKTESVYRITASSIPKYLDIPKFKHGEIEAQDQIGLVTGLAWTQVGGELLSVETLIMPGKGKQILTGKLGDVMKESAQAAFSYIRSRSGDLMLEDEFYEKYDVHIHVPEGAIPKDGPSAGISMCTSLVSSLTQRPVCRDVAMTGEITLRGRVLQVGGLKEKILAAHRGGIQKIIIPKDNEKDLKDIPASVAKQIKFIPVEHMDEVLGHALIVDEGSTLFRKSDVAFEMPSVDSAGQQPLMQ
ncbi:endopeptidase La [Desulfococcaceae bacterium HSG9]|nr:endopeptidase La [Desulfococcaceae bacterium HSG9]